VKACSETRFVVARLSIVYLLHTLLLCNRFFDSGGSVRWANSQLARIIHGFWKSCEELASFAKHFQFDCQMLNFVQAATTEVADLVIERGKNALLKNTPCVGLL